MTFSFDDALARLTAELATHYQNRPPAHDALHVARVARTAAHLCTHEPEANPHVVLAAAHLHELVNLPKNHPDSSRSGDLCADAALALLRAHAWPEALALSVAACIREHSFSKGARPASLSSAILQDADRLDAIGAVGIARCFATCGELGGQLHHPTDPLAKERPLDDKRYALDHFARKLLTLEAGMHTRAARELARARTETLTRFIDDFARELGAFTPAAR